MAEDRKPVPPSRTTLVDEGWSMPPSPPSNTSPLRQEDSSAGLPIPQAPSAPTRPSRPPPPPRAPKGSNTMFGLAPVAIAAQTRGEGPPDGQSALVAPSGTPASNAAHSAPRPEAGENWPLPLEPTAQSVGGCREERESPIGSGGRHLEPLDVFPAQTRDAGATAPLLRPVVLKAPTPAFHASAWHSIRVALLQRVHFGNFSFPLVGLLVASWVIVLLLGLGAFGLAIDRGGAEPKGETLARMDPDGEAEQPDPMPRKNASWEALLAKPKRELQSAEVLAASEAKLVERQKAAQRLGSELGENPALVDDKAVRKELRDMASDPVTARIAQQAMAGLPGEVSADLLYDVWTATAGRNEATTLAQLLVYSKEVFPKASKALRAALDLRAAESCEEYHATLPNVARHGDRRSLHLLLALQRKFGCGSKLKDDCYACLRVGSELADAIKAVRARKPPEL